MMLRDLIVAVALLVSAACGLTNSAPPATRPAAEKWTEHDSAKLSLSLRAPAEWEFEDDVSPDGFAARLLVERGVAQVVIATDGKDIGNADPSAALREWVESVIAKDGAKEARVVEEREQVIADGPARLRILEQPKGQLTIRTLAAYFVHGGRRYIFTFATVDKQFDHLTPDVLRVLDSIRFRESKDGKKD